MVRTTHILIAAVTALVLQACGAAAPVSYSGGVRWNLPLVGPLEDDTLVVPVVIHDHGPYLFALDPDASASMIDRGVAESLGLYTPPQSWREFVDHRDRVVERRPYEVLRMAAGDLQLRNVRMYAVPAGSLEFRGQLLHGVLGRDLLSRTIVIDVDRDRGVVVLALTGHEQVPASATRIDGHVHKITYPARKLVVPIQVNEATTVELAVDFAAHTTAVWSRVLARLGMALTPTREEIVDEFGSRDVVDGRTIAASLGIDGVRASHVSLVPFADRRVDERDYDGVLGQNVLSRFRVVLNPDRRELWLAPRTHDLRTDLDRRIARWGDVFSRCRQVGCAEVRFDGRTLTVMRTADAPDAAYEVVLEAVDRDDTPLPLPLVRVSVATPITRATGPRLAMYRRADAFRVVDVSPFAPACRARGCFAILATESEVRHVPAFAPPGTIAAR